MKKARSGSLGSIASTSPKPTKKSYFILSCPTSPSSSRSSDKRQADCIKQMESLQKENFSLKIRLQFLERKVFNSERDLAEILKHNDLLKNELKSKEMYLNEIMRKEKQKKKGQKSETAEPQTYNSNRMAGTHTKSLEDIDLAKDLLQKSKTILELEKKLATSESKSASLEANAAQRLQQAKYNFSYANHLSSLKSIDATKNCLQRRKMILELEEKVATSKRKASSLDLSSCQRLQQAKDNRSAGLEELEDDVEFFKDSFKKTKKILVLEAAFTKQRQICESFASRYESFMEHLELLKTKINTLDVNDNVKREMTVFMDKNELELRNLCKLNRLLMEKLLPCSDQVPTGGLFEDRTQFTVHSPAMKTDKVVNPEGMKMSAGMSEAHKLIHVVKEKERAKKTDGPGLFPLPEFYTQPPPVENPYREQDFKLAKQNIDIVKRLQQVEESKDIGSVSEFNLGSDMNLMSDIDLLGSSNLIGDSKHVISQERDTKETPTYCNYWNYISSHNTEQDSTNEKGRK